MKKILLIATGGTIASEPSKDGLVPALTGNAIVRMLPQLESLCSIQCEEILRLDSSNLQPENWLQITRAIQENYAGYEGFVITHGTDTMAYTAAALFYMLKNLGKPVVLTGAQLPIEHPNTDGKRNVLDAFRVACEERPGVYLVFGGKVIHGHHARKLYAEQFEAFGSINIPDAASVTDVAVRWREENISVPFTQELHIVETLETHIGVLKLIPGLESCLLDAMITAGCKGIIIEGYGAGGVPNSESNRNFLPAIERAIQAGIPIVCTSQCVYDGVDLTKYPIGTLAKRIGAISGGKQTLESLTVKFMIALGTFSDSHEIKKYIEIP